MNERPDCHVCRQNGQLAMLPPRERIGVDEYWRVAHAFDTGLEGWLVLVPRRHVTSVADLTDTEASALGLWQVRPSRALAAVTGCVKTYVIQFAEAEGFSHVHFHVVPRSADLPARLRGGAIFGLLGVPSELAVPTATMDRLAELIGTSVS